MTGTTGFDIDLERSPWAGDLLHAVARALACAQLVREERLHERVPDNEADVRRVRNRLVELLAAMPEPEHGPWTLRVEDPFNPSLPLHESQSGDGEAANRWVITPFVAEGQFRADLPPWLRRRNACSMVAVTHEGHPMVGVIAGQQAADGAGEIVAFARGELLRTWVWSMYRGAAGPRWADPWLGLAWDCLRTPEFVRHRPTQADLAGLPAGFMDAHLAGQAIRAAFLDEPDASPFSAAFSFQRTVSAVRKALAETGAYGFGPDDAEEDHEVPGPHAGPLPPVEWMALPPAAWARLSPLGRARAHGALLGLLTGAWAASQLRGMQEDAERWYPGLPPQMDERAERYGYDLADDTMPYIPPGGLRAALVTAHTLIRCGRFDRDDLQQAYRAAGVPAEPSDEPLAWHLARVVPIAVFAAGALRALPADVDLEHYRPPVLGGEPPEWADPSEAAVAALLELIDGFAAADARITHAAAVSAQQASLMAMVMTRMLHVDAEDPLAQLRRPPPGASFARDEAGDEAGDGPIVRPDPQETQSRRQGHVFRDQQPVIYNPQLDEVHDLSLPHGPDDEDLEPLPEGVGIGPRGAAHTRASSGFHICDETQPHRDEPADGMVMNLQRMVESFDPGDRPPWHTYVVAFAAFENLARSTSTLDAVYRSVTLPYGSTLSSGMSLALIGSVYGWRGIPTRWQQSCWSEAHFEGTGVSAEDLHSGRLAEALLQCGYRWAAAWLAHRTVDVSGLVRREGAEDGQRG